jgi:hypothetical protein
MTHRKATGRAGPGRRSPGRSEGTHRRVERKLGFEPESAVRFELHPRSRAVSVARMLDNPTYPTVQMLGEPVASQ